MHLKLNRTMPEIMYRYAQNQASRGIDMQICAIEELILNWNYSLSYHSNENSDTDNTWPESAKIQHCNIRGFIKVVIFGGVMTVKPRRCKFNMEG
jgi:hypothetical protein